MAEQNQHQTRLDSCERELIAARIDIARLEEQKETADAALSRIAEKQQEALAIIRDNGFVFESIGQEPGNWQHLAFTLYNEICEIDTWARDALDIGIAEQVPYPASEPERP